MPAVLRRLRGGAKLPVTVMDRANQTALASGTLDTVDNQVDTTTGTVKLRALFDNADEALFPNQFVNATLLVDTVRGAVLLPSAAVQQGGTGPSVYRVGAENKVAVQAIRMGASDGSHVVVLSGVAAGDRVVVDGADRLKDGATVTIPAP
jgi:multidrug efflux system membrane fusion protein